MAADPLLDGLPDQPVADNLLTGIPDKTPPLGAQAGMALKFEPVGYADSIRKGRELGVGTEVVARNPAEADDILFRRKVEQIGQQNPTLAAWLAGDDNLVLARDDLDALHNISLAMRARDLAVAPIRGLSGGIGRGISGLGNLIDSGAYGISRGGYAVRDFVLEDVPAALGDLGDMANPARAYGPAIGPSRTTAVEQARIAERRTPENLAEQYMAESRDSSTNPATWLRELGGWVEGGGLNSQMLRSVGFDDPWAPLPEERSNLGTDIAEGFGNLVGQAVATFVNPAAGVALMAGQGADQQAERAEKAGATEGEKAAATAVGATITAVTEKIGLDKLLNRLPPKVKSRAAQWVADKIIGAGIEGTQEAIEQVANNATAQLIYDPESPLLEGVGDNFTVGAGVGALARTVFGVRGRYDEANEVKSQQTQLDGMVESVGKTNLSTLAPDRMRDLLGNLAPEGATKVYVPAEKLVTMFQSLEPAQVTEMLGVPLSDVQEAALTGGDVAIPIQNYLVNVAPEHHEALREFARFTPGGMTPEETLQAEEAAQEAADRFMASVQSETPSDQRVFDDVSGMLLGTGRYRREDVEKYAALMQAGFRTLAAREGADAFDLYRQYRLRIESELPAALQQVDVDTVIDPLIERLRAGDRPRDNRVPLADFLAETGGLTDAKLAGELATLNENDRVTRAGKKRLVRADATRDLDVAREAAAEAGYLPMESDINDFLALLEQDLSGNRVYAEGFESTPESEAARAFDALDEELGRRGIDVSKATNAEIKAALFGSGETPQVPDELVQVFDQAAYHGTPHTVDRFSLQKIGSGEGNQAFGWGLYFASQREVAEAYREALAGSGPAQYVVDGKTVFTGNPRSPRDMAVYFKANGGRNWAKHADGLRDQGANEEFVRKFEDESRKLERKRVERREEKKGQVYQVEVPDDGDLLDYDKPLSQQPEKVKAALEMAFGDDPARGGAIRGEFGGATQYTGVSLYAGLARELGSERAASEALLAAGIPGLRYADGMTRGTENATHNYVIWDENAISEPTTLYQSQPDQTETEAFKRWFGDSKVVDADGRPLVVYHGTWADFEVFDFGRLGQTTDANATDADLAQTARVGTWFSDRDVSDDIGATRNVAAYLSIQNPKVYGSLEQVSRAAKRAGGGNNLRAHLEAQGFDGVRATDEEFGGVSYVAFRPEQIKSATANSGAFDPNSPSILNQSDRAEEAIRRGYIKFGGDRAFTIGLLKDADATTFLHETGHFFLEVLGDLAADPNASPGIIADYQAALNWLGVESREQIGTEQHEKWARGFEQYLGEGKAPSAELQGAFARFRAWVKAIYRTLTALNVELSDDVRGVFDRLLATDEEISQAEAGMDYAPLFADARSAGWSDAEFATRLKLQEQAREEAESRLMARAMKDVTRETKAWWKERSEEVRAQVTAEVDAMPVYRAWALLADGTQPDGTPIDGAGQKLDKGWLVRQYGQEWLNKHLLRKRVYSVSNGADPDVVATGVGFESGDGMVRALANAQPRDAYISAETHRRMIEQYGDVLTDGSMPEQAMRAVHGNKRMRAMEADIRALERLAGTPRPSRVDARQVAERIVAGKKVRDLQPNTYLRAERKAAKEAIQAAGRQEWGKALEAQRRRLLNAHLYDVASKAKDETERLNRWLRRFEKPALRARLGKIGRLEQVEAILDGYDLRRVSGRQIDRDKAAGELLRLVDDGTLVAPRALLQRLQSGRRTNWRELTVEELRGLRDVLAQTEAAARAEYEAFLNDEKVRIDDKADQVAASTLDGGKPVMPTYGAISPDETVKGYGKQALLSWLRPSALARLLDGGNDDGAWTRNIIQPIRRAMAEKLEPMKRKAQEDLSALYRAAYTTKEMAHMNERSVVPGLGIPLSRWDLVSLALNWGNADNRRAVLDSEVAGRRPYTEAGVQQALATLDARDWAFVQSVWDYIDTYWPAIKETQKRRKGIAPPKVEALPFVVTSRDGQQVELRGGYYPLKYNAKLDARSRQHEMDEAYERMRAGTLSATQTKYGHNQERVGSGRQPVLLSMNVLHNHVNNVIQDIALGDAVNYVDRVLTRPQVRQALIETGNLDALETLKLWLKDTATGEIGARSGIEQMAQLVRFGFTKSKIGFNLVTVGMQITGLAQTIPVVGAKWTAIGATDFARNPRSAIKQVMDESAFMRSRYELNNFNKDIAAVQEALRSGAPVGKGSGFIGGFIQAVRAVQLPPQLVSWAFLGIRTTQIAVDTTTWLAGYNKAKDSGQAHDEAVRYADGIVENAQTSGMFSDRSAIERGTFSETTRQSEFVKLWTTLMSYMIAKGNIAYESYRRTDFKSPQQVLSFGTDMLLLFTVEAILQTAIRGGFPDEDESWFDWLTWGLFETGKGIVGTIPIVREVPSFYAGYGAGGGPIGATLRDVSTAAQQTSQFLGDGPQAGEVDRQLVKSYINVVGTATGAPSAQINRFVDAYWRENVDGEDVPAYEYFIGKRKE